MTTGLRAAALAGAAQALAGALGAGRGMGADGAAAPGAQGAPRPAGRFDRAVDGLNRLPRPLFALGALGLFGYALAEPEGFARRMAALAAVPEPLWWLIGAVVSFHFGAREAHHFRERAGQAGRTGAPAPAATAAPSAGAGAGGG